MTILLHLSQDQRWCYERAMVYANNGEISDAAASFLSDLNKVDRATLESEENRFAVLFLPFQRDADSFKNAILSFYSHYLDV